MATSKTHLSLLDQAQSPLQTFILLAQLQMLRAQERLRSRSGVTSPETLLTIFVALLVLFGTFGIGLTAAAVFDHTRIEFAPAAAAAAAATR